MSHPKSPQTNPLLAQAEQEAERYQWTTAAELYQQALKQIDSNQEPSKAAQLNEQLAYSNSRAAFQAKNREQFKDNMRQAKSAYQEAARLYEQASKALSTSANARSHFADYWVQDSNNERRATIRQCIALAENATTLFEEHHDQGSLAQTHLDLLAFYWESLQLSPNLGEKKEQFEKALSIGEKAVAECERDGSSKQLVRALSTTVVTTLLIAESLVNPARYQELSKRAQDLSIKALNVANQLETHYELGLAHLAAASAATMSKEWCKSHLLSKTGISYTEKTGDSFLLGELCVCGTTAAFWCTFDEIEDVEKASETIQSGISLAAKGMSHLAIPLQRQEMTVGYGWYSECFRLQAEIADDPEKKKEQLERAIETARKGLEYADPQLQSDSVHALAKSLYFQAIYFEPDTDKRIKILQESLRLREISIQFGLALFPEAWDMGVMYNYLALVKAALSKNEESSQAKKELLQGAVKDMQQCLELCTRWAKEPSYLHSTSSYARWYGDVLGELYHLTGNVEDAHRTIEAYQNAIGFLERSGFTVEIAPIRWSIAKTQDGLGDYKTASEEFQRAAKDFRSAAEKIHASTSVFLELAAYMDAWSLIERARLSHRDEQYSIASEEYSKSASALKQTRMWNALAEHYEGCSLLEEGESLSRQEYEEKAVHSFSQAAEHFEAGTKTLEAALKQVTGEEAEELRNWLKLTESRMKYAKARADLEKARLLDGKGEKITSLTNYRKASETFKELIPETQNEQARREIETLVFFCDAWAKMKEAEAKASADLYIEAASLFEKAKQASENEKSDRLALANAAICRALVAGTRFRRARDPQLYSEIKRELETAADYYQEGGFAKAANWTRATQRLFDALLYLGDAEAEKEARKKAELYHLAEQHLQLAAKIYDGAGFAGKRDEAQRHLERAREEKAILLTPLEVLAENPTASAGAASPVSLLRDQAIGSERYESANVVGNMSLHQKDVNVGGDLSLELEIANVGKTPAMLMKLENLVPEGFEIQHDKTPLHVENGYINMKGKRLEYLKTDEVKIALKALRKGAFKLRPRILFVDDKGSYRSYDFEPTEVTVSELGISGWLRGTGR